MSLVREWWLAGPGASDARYSRALLGILLVLWALGMLFGKYATNVFALTPGYTLSNYYIWTFFTAGLFDNSFSMGLINVSVYALVAPRLERAWGSYSFAKFVCVTNVCVMVSIFFNMVACYAATEYEPCLYRAVCGFSGVNAAFAVALKQKFGDRSVIPGVPGVELLKFNHLPIAIGWASLVLWLTGSLGGKEAPLIFFGTFYAFVYLRFFMRDESTGIVGDLRREFAAATFFPDIGGLRALVDFFGTVAFQSLLRLGLFADAVRTNQGLPSSSQDSELLLGAGQQHGAPLTSGTADAYRAVDPAAERRRLMAIKAIDDKLAELARAPVPSGASYLHEPQQQQALLSQGGAAALPSPDHQTHASPAAASAAEAASSAALVAAALPSEAELARMEAELAGQPTA